MRLHCKRRRRRTAATAPEWRAVLTPEAIAFVNDLADRFSERARATARPARGRAARVRRRQAAGLPGGNPGAARRGLARRRDPAGPPRPARRDHGTARAQDGHQCAQLRRQRLHGGLRGFAVPDLGQPRRRAGEPDAGGAPRPHADDARGQVLPARTKRPRCWWCGRAAGTCPKSTGCTATSRSPARSWTSACTCTTTPPNSCAGARGRTSTCRSWRTVSRRGSGRTSSRMPSARSGCHAGR